MKKITQEQYHHAMALYMIARRKQAEVDDLEKEANNILGDDPGSHLSDAIYTYENTGTKDEFDEAISKMDVEIESQQEKP